MNQSHSRAVQDGLKHIHETYAFLLERGYQILSAEEADAGWQVLLGKQDLLVSVLRSRGDDYVSLQTNTQPPGESIDLGSVVYAATGERIPLYGSDSQKLQQYLDPIETYFAQEYPGNPDGLRAARAAYREPLYKLEPLVPKEPGRIPILYYPLMGIIVLLTFFFVITLCGVLLDRLLGVFPP
jgi:hypothetical protein